jgi:hypothetical protein
MCRLRSSCSSSAFLSFAGFNAPVLPVPSSVRAAVKCGLLGLDPGHQRLL